MSYILEEKHLNTGAIIFPNLDQTDFTAPFEVLSLILKLVRKMIKLKQYLWIAVLIVLVISVFPAYSRGYPQSGSGFQVSTLGALNVGVYEGASTIAELREQGDFGLGTFEGLDGEMVVFEGRVYQVKSDGVAYPVRDRVKTPFAAVTFFRKERLAQSATPKEPLPLSGQATYQELQQQIDQQLPTRNLPYAIRIKGNFPALKVRSEPKQAPPYRPLAEVLNQQQVVFELRDVAGTLIGFRLPQYLKDVNAAGYHLHFITSDRKKGGHLLDGQFLNPIVDVETLKDWRITLPNNPAFEQASLGN